MLNQTVLPQEKSCIKLDDGDTLIEVQINKCKVQKKSINLVTDLEPIIEAREPPQKFAAT